MLLYDTFYKGKREHLYFWKGKWINGREALDVGFRPCKTCGHLIHPPVLSGSVCSKECAEYQKRINSF